MSRQTGKPNSSKLNAYIAGIGFSLVLWSSVAAAAALI